MVTTAPRARAEQATAWLVGQNDPGALDVALVGGKALALARAGRAGLPVPDWRCVTTDLWEHIFALVRGEVEAALAVASPSNANELRDASKRCQRAFATVTLPPKIVSVLLDALAVMGARHYAVRSSAVAEDSKKDSFAGQFDTFLNVAPLDVPARIVECMASTFSERALLYRHHRGLGLGESRCAVLVQPLVKVRAAGVLFSADPTTGDLRRVLISASPGLGEGVVAGTVECDTFHLDAGTGAMALAQVADKSHAVVSNEAGGTRLAKLAENARNAPTLDASALSGLLKLTRLAQKTFGPLLDIEWAIDVDDKLWMLQVRPITTMALERRGLFDNSNIVENYPGLTSPLTFSFVRQSYRAVFHAALVALGVSSTELVAHEATLENLVALVDGRLFYQLDNWYRVFGIVPGFENLIPAFERGLGVDKRGDSSAPKIGAGPARARGVLGVVARLGAEYGRIRGKSEAFLASLQETQQTLRARDAGDASAHDLLDELRRIKRALGGPYHVSILNDLYGQQFHALLGKLLVKWAVGDDRLLNQLLTGENVASVEPVRSLSGVAAALRQEPDLCSVLRGEIPAIAWRKLHEDPRWRVLAARVDAHFEAFGDRTLEELKLETPRPQESPVIAIRLLRQALDYEAPSSDPGARERATRAAAERELLMRTRGQPVRRLILQKVLGGLRLALATRESLRLARSRAFGMVRRFYLALGSKLHDRRLLLAAEDVFFLSEDEVDGLVRGHAVTRDVPALVALRRQEYEGFRSKDPPSRFVTKGVVTNAVRSKDSSAADPSAAFADGSLRGIGCGGGRTRGAVALVTTADPMIDTRGRVLVASTTDPGWVYLMVNAAALVAERGSPLSHTAIIGRELGIPTVVGVARATELLPEGAMIEVDGDAGGVRILPTADGPAADRTDHKSRA